MAERTNKINELGVTHTSQCRCQKKNPLAKHFSSHVFSALTDWITVRRTPSKLLTLQTLLFNYLRIILTFITISCDYDNYCYCFSAYLAIISVAQRTNWSMILFSCWLAATFCCSGMVMCVWSVYKNLRKMKNVSTHSSHLFGIKWSLSYWFQVSIVFFNYLMYSFSLVHGNLLASITCFR